MLYPRGSGIVSKTRGIRAVAWMSIPKLLSIVVNDRLILHVLNLTSAGTWRAPIDELIPIGPLQFKIRLPENFQPAKFQTLVSSKGRMLNSNVATGWASFQLDAVLDHEVVVMEA
jgi:hypothetical protein